MDKNQIVDIAQNGFEKAQGIDIWDRIAEHASDKTDALKAGWRLGFHYALTAMEKGIVGIIDPTKN